MERAPIYLTAAILVTVAGGVEGACLNLLVDGRPTRLCEGDPPPSISPPRPEKPITGGAESLAGDNMRDLMGRLESMDPPGKVLNCRTVTLEGLAFRVCD